MTDYSLRLEISGLGFNRLTYDGGVEGISSTSCRVYGSGIVDRVARAILSVLSYFFEGLKPIKVKLLSKSQENGLHVKSSKLYVTSHAVAEIMKTHLLCHASKKGYTNAENGITHLLMDKPYETTKVHLQQAAGNMEKQLDLSVHSNWRDIFSEFVGYVQDMLKSPKPFECTLLINNEGQVMPLPKQGSVDETWHRVIFGIVQRANESGTKVPSLALQFPRGVNNYYLKQLQLSWQEILKKQEDATETGEDSSADQCRALILDAIDSLERKICECEFNKFVMKPTSGEKGNKIHLNIPRPPKQQTEVNEGDEPASSTTPGADGKPTANVKTPTVSAEEVIFDTKSLNAHRIKIGDFSYIARSLPDGDDFDDVARFWEMLRQEKSPLFVKLNAEPSAYWPPLGQSYKFNQPNLEVKCIQEEVDETSLFVERKFLLTSLQGGAQEITQIEFRGWQDGGAASEEDMEFLLDKVDAKRQELSMTPDQPMTVHCFAGIGRTGTFIAAHAIKQNPELKLHDVVNAMRQQRPKNMIEHDWQYFLVQKLRQNWLKNKENV